MRASGPRWPRAIWSAAPMPPIGTKPSCRTASRVPRARDVDGAEPLQRRPARLPVAERQQRMDGPAGAVLLDGARVRRDCVLRGAQQLGVACDRVGAEEDVVGLLRRPREGAPEAVDEDDDAVVADGEGVAPQPERVCEPQMGGEERVRLLARQERRRPRNPDHERVERLVEGRSTQLDRAEQRLGVRDGRRPREDGCRGPRPAQRAENAATNRFRRGREGVPQRRACDALGGLGLVGIAAQQACEHAGG